MNPHLNRLRVQHIMPLRHIYVLFLALFIVTTGYHIMKRKSVWKWTMKRFSHPLLPPIAPLLLVPIDIFPTKNDSTVLYASEPSSISLSKSERLDVKVGYHRPLHRLVSRRRRR